MICHRCKKDKELCKSHIIPEFFYKPLYDHNHRFKKTTTDQDEKSIPYQKGLRERLLCKQCETIFSRYEKYVKNLFYDQSTRNFIEEKDNITILGIDYPIVKLFQLSLIWRIGISSLYKNINLGKHEETIRQILLKEEPGKESDYGCMILIPNEMDQLDKMILAPFIIRVDGHKCYSILLGGMFWVFFVSSHLPDIRYRNHFLSKTEKLILSRENFGLIGLFKEVTQKLGKEI